MTDNAIELRNIEKSFGPVEVLKGVSLSVPPSRCYGLVGRQRGRQVHAAEDPQRCASP